MSSPTHTGRLQRRTLLRAAAASATAWPLMIERAFACPPPLTKCDELPPGVDDVQGAWRAAVENKRAMLVVLIPDGDSARFERGQLFGELLNHGDIDQLAPLSLTEIVCAPLAALTALVPQAQQDTDALAVVVEPSVPPVVRYVRATVRQYTGEAAERTERALWEERIGRERIATVAAALREQIVTTPERVRLMGGGTDAVTRLAEQVRAAVVTHAPRGTRWATQDGCGFDIEGDGREGHVLCGMGHAPRLSRRFLYFFADERR